MNERQCINCSKTFQFPVQRGRKPIRCPECREKVKSAFRAKKEEDK